METVVINGKIIEEFPRKEQSGRFKFPLEIKPLDAQINSQLLEKFTGETEGFVQVGPQKYILPRRYKNEAENFYNLQLRSDDVWIVTYPRSGTTWMQEMLWLLSNNLDYKKASEIPITTRFPFLEFNIFVSPEMKQKFIQENSYSSVLKAKTEFLDYPAWKTFEKMTEQRFIKTHLPFSLLPPDLLTKGCKVIYVARNPKDVAVSFYHHSRLFRTQGFVGDFPTFWHCFENNLVHWAPFWSHIQEGWEQRNNPNVLFLFYETLNKDLKSGIQKVAHFLEKDLSESELDRLEKHLQFENFRKNSSVNYDFCKEIGILKRDEADFVRKGKNGGWKDDFTPEINRRADRWIEENSKKTTLRFPV